MENLKKSFLVRGNNIVGFSDKKNFSTAPLGTVLSFAGQARPNGYLLCDGASYKVTDYPDLYAVIGNTYGGDSTNFNVPNLVDASQSPAPTMIYIIKAFHTNEGVDSDAGSGEENKIDSISVNGSPVSIDENKNVDITVPDAYDDTALVKRVSDIESDYAKSSDIPSFDGYATEDYVAEQIDNIPSVDLTDYAKKNEIPDVSGYITEEQLLAKDYVDKAYVAEEITKVSDATNAENLKLSDGTIVDADTIDTKLSKVDNKIDKPTSATEGQVLTYRNNEWVADDSQGGGGQFVIIAKGKSYEGQTVTATKGTKSKSAVITSGVARIPVDEGGVWTLTLSSGETWNTPNMTYYGEYEVALVPNGSTVTPIDDVQTWLHCANIWDKSYKTVSEVIADKTILNALVQNENANDYLVRSTAFANTLCENNVNNEAMYYLGLYSECANKLLADNTWLEAICNADVLLSDGATHLFEKVLNVKVPTMTSNTAPSGEVIASSVGDNRYALYAFDGNNDTFWSSSSEEGSSGIIAYKFPNSVNVKRLKILLFRLTGFKVIARNNDTEEWITLKTVSGLSGETQSLDEVIEDNDNYYLQYGIQATGNTTQWGTVVFELQFYGREV